MWHGVTFRQWERGTCCEVVYIHMVCGLLPDIIGYPLVRVVHQSPCLHLVERPVLEVICCELIGHPFPPFQRQYTEEVVSQHIDLQV